jgi:hypothetical protein
MTPALSGAAGFLSGKERDQDRRGAAAASAANQSFALSQRKREFAFRSALDLYDRERQRDRDEQADAESAYDRLRDVSRDKDANKRNDKLVDLREKEFAESQRRHNYSVAKDNRDHADRLQESRQQDSGQLTGQYQDLWLRDSASLIDDQASRIQEEMAEANLTPEGKRIWGELSGNLRAIQSQRSGLRPQQYSQAMQQFFDKYQKSNLDAYRTEPPTVSSEMQSRFQDLGTGMGVFMQPDGKFQVLELDPSKTGSAKSQGDTMSSPAAATFSDVMNDEKRFSKAYEDAEKSLRESYLQNLPADADPGEGPPEFTPAQIAVEMERRFMDQQEAARKAAEARTRARQMILGEDSSPGQASQEGQPVVPESTAAGSQSPDPVASMIQDAESVIQLGEELESQRIESMSVGQQIQELDSQYEAMMRHKGRRGFDRQAAESIKNQLDALRKQQQSTQKQMDAGVKTMQSYRDKQIEKQPGVQKLRESGHSPDDLAAAIRKIGGYRQKYPDLQNLDELSDKERKEITEALKVIRAAQQ